MSIKFRKYSRQLHLWFSLVILIPALIVIGSGLLLQVKKQSDWIQPPTLKTQSTMPAASFGQILDAAKLVPEANINNWQDIARIDVRPDKGVLKVQSKNHWEIQLDAGSAEVLQVAYRRSDIIEAIHDGSWFFKGANLWLFLPAAILLLMMWITGIVMLFGFIKSRHNRRKYRTSSSNGS